MQLGKVSNQLAQYVSRRGSLGLGTSEVVRWAVCNVTAIEM